MTRRRTRVLGVVAVTWAAIAFLGIGFRVLADCSSFGLPFTDLGSETTFCAAIAEAYYTGITNGTSATTFSPTDNVPRDQMVAFIDRGLDKGLSRDNRRTKLQQFWNGAPRWDLGFGLTAVGANPQFIASDGLDVWVSLYDDATVYRVRASDGSVQAHWTGATNGLGVLVALGRIFITGNTSPGNLYMIDPTAAPGAVTTVSNLLGIGPVGITFDGTKIWTANGSSVSIITPGSSTPWATTNITTGFVNPFGAIFDGANVWVTDRGDNTIKKLDAGGAILQSVPVGAKPIIPAFDGTNIWVPNLIDNSVSVVRASTGTVLATLTGNGLSSPQVAAFDGQRILVTNYSGGLSLFQATTLAAIGNPATTGMFNPSGACSDGSSFWIGDNGGSHIGRF